MTQSATMTPGRRTSRRVLRALALILPASCAPAWWWRAHPPEPLATHARRIPAPEPRPTAPGPVAWKEMGRVVREGIAIEFLMGRAAPVADEPAFREGEDVGFAFRLTYAERGGPLTRANPAGWVVRRMPGTRTDERSAFRQVESLVSRNLFTRAPLDLTSYFALSLNHDSVAVIDPLFGFGGTKLLALLPLGGIGHDWALAPDERRLFVSVPQGRRVVGVDARQWKLLPPGVPTSLPPEQLAFQPDGQYLWAAEGEDPSGRLVSGVTVIDPATIAVVTRIPTGKGPHRLALDGDRRVFVTNAGSGTVTVIDPANLSKQVTLTTGPHPLAIDFSAQARQAYVLHERNGALVAVDGRRGMVSRRPLSLPGVTRLRFAPGGRFAFLLNPERRSVAVLDIADHRIVKRGTLEHEPERVAFSAHFAYIHHRGGPGVTIVPLADLGKAGDLLSASELPMGRTPFGRVEAETPADSVAPVPGGDAVLIAHALDQSVHFFKEGMNAPMSECRTYGGQPRAVLVVDRSLSERSRPGTYETFARLPEAGSHDLLFFLDSPRVVHGFPFEVAVDPALTRAREAGRFDLEWIAQGATTPVDRPCSLALCLTDRRRRTPMSDRAEVFISIFAPGAYQGRCSARHRGDGVYAFEFTPPAEGVYYLNLQDPAPPDDLGREKTLLLRAVRSADPETASP